MIKALPNEKLLNKLLTALLRVDMKYTLLHLIMVIELVKLN